MPKINLVDELLKQSAYLSNGVINLMRPSVVPIRA